MKKEQAKPESAAEKNDARMPGFFVRLPEEFNTWFQAYLREDGYTNPAELVRDLLRERKQKVEALQKRKGG